MMMVVRIVIGHECERDMNMRGDQLEWKGEERILRKGTGPKCTMCSKIA
jgi:hypothetical protein